MLTLPAVDPRRKWRIVGLGYLAFSIFYLAAGHIRLGPPVPLVRFWVDERVPFIDWTIWIYVSQFMFLFGTLYLINERVNLSRVLWGMGLASFLSFVVFFSFPTTFPRNHEVRESITGSAIKLLYLIDPVANCFPSLHVSLAGIAALGVVHERRSLGWLVIPWAILLMLSTLTTKQHYAVDVIGGLAILFLCYSLFKSIRFSSPSNN